MEIVIVKEVENNVLAQARTNQSRQADYQVIGELARDELLEKAPVQSIGVQP